MYPRRLALLAPSDWREHMETPSRESEDAVETERFRLGHGSGGRARVGEMEGDGRLADESMLLVMVMVLVLLVVACLEFGVDEEERLSDNSALLMAVLPVVVSSGFGME